MIDRVEAGEPRLLAFLRSHPRISKVVESDVQGIRFSTGQWHRAVHQGNPGAPLAGLVELMDNNPLVCADEASVPDPASTLALIALGPLIRAGLLAERPTMMLSQDASEDLIAPFLALEGWSEGLTLDAQSLELGTAVAATVIAAIHTPSRAEDLDDLYAEAYGRSFFVRRDEDSEWDTRLVVDKAHALFRIRLAEDQPQSLLTIQVMADEHGKCGQAQLIHCMNVMAGFEETLGIA